ncbi:lytic polysaccharide monooxygenase auxiliary activity family 9 protein [Streptomyces sp. NPDC002454]|uniref:lytic polysaccharide monooxygenase auxiliary activity family 9 protein n=1 Tax=unclassified Streptomyces TaxID=2593676 RepID=UPI0033246FAA
MRKKMYAAMLGLATVGAMSFATGSASSHGYTEEPTSRQKACSNSGTVKGCGSIQWEPQSVEGPKGFPAKGPADGKICSAGNGGFSALDHHKQPNGNPWPTTKLTGGQNYNFKWKFTAAHATTDFKYYITKDGWNQNAALTRDALEPAPFLTVPYNGQRPPFSFSHSGQVPTGKSGSHVVLAVWTVHDTPNAFYACSDVSF